MDSNASEFVGNIPENYDLRLGPIIFQDYAHDLSERAVKTVPNHVLELAAGTGIVSRILRDALTPDINLTVTDLNEPMIDVAKAKFRDGENITFAAADAMNLDFPDDSFDLVVCQFGVMFFPDKQASFREALRVLKPGGKYLFNCWGSLSENSFAQIARDVSTSYFPENPPGFYQVPFSYSDPKTVEQDLLDAEFHAVEHETIGLNKSVNDWGHFARGLVYGNPLIDEIKARGGVDPEEVAMTIENRLRDTLGNEPGSLPLKAAVFCGKTRR